MDYVTEFFSRESKKYAFFKKNNKINFIKLVDVFKLIKIILDYMTLIVYKKKEKKDLCNMHYCKKKSFENGFCKDHNTHLNIGNLLFCIFFKLFSFDKNRIKYILLEFTKITHMNLNELNNLKNRNKCINCKKNSSKYELILGYCSDCCCKCYHKDCNNSVLRPGEVCYLHKTKENIKCTECDKELEDLVCEDCKDTCKCCYSSMESEGIIINKEKFCKSCVNTDFEKNKQKSLIISNFDILSDYFNMKRKSEEYKNVIRYSLEITKNTNYYLQIARELAGDFVFRTPCCNSPIPNGIFGTYKSDYNQELCDFCYNRKGSMECCKSACLLKRCDYNENCCHSFAGTVDDCFAIECPHCSKYFTPDRRIYDTLESAHSGVIDWVRENNIDEEFYFSGMFFQVVLDVKPEVIKYIMYNYSKFKNNNVPNIKNLINYFGKDNFEYKGLIRTWDQDSVIYANKKKIEDIYDWTIYRVTDIYEEENIVRFHCIPSNLKILFEKTYKLWKDSEEERLLKFMETF